MCIKVRWKSPLFLWLFSLVSVCLLVVYVGDSLTLPRPRYVASVALRSFFGQTPFGIPHRNFTNSSDSSLFIFSAHERCPANKFLLVNTWLRLKYQNGRSEVSSQLFCCFLLPNKSTVKTEVTWRLGLYGKAPLPVRRLQCRAPITGSYAVTVVNVPTITRLSGKNDTANITETTNSTVNKIATNTVHHVLCPTSLDHYVLPATPITPETYSNQIEAESTKIDQNCLTPPKRDIHMDQNETFSFAVCAKLAYGNLGSQLLIEWMEYNLKMGVSKIIAYTHNLNSQAARVLKHYENEGKVVTFPFDIPSPKNPKRTLGQKNHDAWNDEQVALYDCYDRLRLYKYVAVVDFDELIVPTIDNNFKDLMNRLQEAAPKASKFIFKIMYHITDWAGNVTLGPDNILSLTYRNHTQPISANVKHVTMPGRTHFGATWTHSVPRMLTPYIGYHVPEKFAAISHYRSCRKQWKKSCFKQHRTNTSKIFRLVEDSLQTAILQKKKLLSL